MLLSRRFPIHLVLAYFLAQAPYAAVWAAIVYALYAYAELEFLRVPFLPIGVIGTAVAFYVGFKNNAAYDRFWEGRKIWGGIVNASRTWATCVTSYVQPGDDSTAARNVRRELVYRQLAWINALRLQLRRTSRFFEKPSPTTRRRLERHAEVMRNDWDRELAPFLSAEELSATSELANPATHLLRWQARTLAGLVQAKHLDLFHQIALMEVVQNLYDLQGQSERIKNTPFPRQYAEYSRIFTKVFALVVPFGLLDVFAGNVAAASTALGTWLPIIPMIVASTLVTWVFVTMEGIGDSSEDPFERSMNDVPMNALCRTIEIDLRQMLGETELPEKERAHDHVLY
jgi:putative membrane protein